MDSSLLPAQIQDIMKKMFDTSENIHIRNNYRQRADVIRLKLNEAVTKFDREYELINPRK